MGRSAEVGRRAPGIALFTLVALALMPGIAVADAQAIRAPTGSAGPQLPSDPARTAGYLLGTCLMILVFYPEMMDWLAARNQRMRRQMVVSAQPARPDQIVDVSPQARRVHHHALSLSILELVVLNAVVSGTMLSLFVSPADGNVLFVLGGAALLLWLRTRNAAGHRPTAGYRPTRRYRRSIGVMVLVGASVGVGLAGLALVLVGAFVGNSDGAIELTAGTADLGFMIEILGLTVLGASVALYRFARRISMSRPSPMVLADQRPSILYLRSFADDKLRLRVAPFARPSLLERLSSRRKQGFEEIMAEELRQYGPLVAVGEPGRRLAPIGFVREYLPDADWRRHVQQRMYHSGVIIVTVGRSRGLEWEIQELIHTGAWRKVVFVFPPVDAPDILQRWEKLVPLLYHVGLRGIGLPSDSSCLLAMTFTVEAECRYYCAKYPDAWSYKAAMAAALADLAVAAWRQSGGSADQHSQQR